MSDFEDTQDVANKEWTLRASRGPGEPSSAQGNWFLEGKLLQGWSSGKEWLEYKLAKPWKPGSNRTSTTWSSEQSDDLGSKFVRSGGSRIRLQASEQHGGGGCLTKRAASWTELSTRLEVDREPECNDEAPAGYYEVERSCASLPKWVSQNTTPERQTGVVKKKDVVSSFPLHDISTSFSTLGESYVGMDGSQFRTPRGSARSRSRSCPASHRSTQSCSSSEESESIDEADGMIDNTPDVKTQGSSRNPERSRSSNRVASRAASASETSGSEFSTSRDGSVNAEVHRPAQKITATDDDDVLNTSQPSHESGSEPPDTSEDSDGNLQGDDPTHFSRPLTHAADSTHGNNCEELNYRPGVDVSGLVAGLQSQSGQLQHETNAEALEGDASVAGSRYAESQQWRPLPFGPSSTSTAVDAPEFPQHQQFHAVRWGGGNTPGPRFFGEHRLLGQPFRPQTSSEAIETSRFFQQNESHTVQFGQGNNSNAFGANGQVNRTGFYGGPQTNAMNFRPENSWKATDAVPNVDASRLRPIAPTRPCNTLEYSSGAHNVQSFVPPPQDAHYSLWGGRGLSLSRFLPTAAQRGVGPSYNPPPIEAPATTNASTEVESPRANSASTKTEEIMAGISRSLSSVSQSTSYGWNRVSGPPMSSNPSVSIPTLGEGESSSPVVNPSDVSMTEEGGAESNFTTEQSIESPGTSEAVFAPESISFSAFQVEQYEPVIIPKATRRMYPSRPERSGPSNNHMDFVHKLSGFGAGSVPDTYGGTNELGTKEPDAAKAAKEGNVDDDGLKKPLLPEQSKHKDENKEICNPLWQGGTFQKGTQWLRKKREERRATHGVCSSGFFKGWTTRRLSCTAFCCFLMLAILVAAVCVGYFVLDTDKVENAGPATASSGVIPSGDELRSSDTGDPPIQEQSAPSISQDDALDPGPADLKTPSEGMGAVSQPPDDSPESPTPPGATPVSEQSQNVENDAGDEYGASSAVPPTPNVPPGGAKQQHPPHSATPYVNPPHPSPPSVAHPATAFPEDIIGNDAEGESDLNRPPTCMVPLDAPVVQLDSLPVGPGQELITSIVGEGLDSVGGDRKLFPERCYEVVVEVNDYGGTNTTVADFLEPRTSFMNVAFADETEELTGQRGLRQWSMNDEEDENRYMLIRKTLRGLRQFSEKSHISVVLSAGQKTLDVRFQPPKSSSVNVTVGFDLLTGPDRKRSYVFDTVEVETGNDAADKPPAVESSHALSPMPAPSALTEPMMSPEDAYEPEIEESANQLFPPMPAPRGFPEPIVLPENASEPEIEEIVSPLLPPMAAPGDLHHPIPSVEDAYGPEIDKSVGELQPPMPAPSALNEPVMSPEDAYEQDVEGIVSQSLFPMPAQGNLLHQMTSLEDVYEPEIEKSVGQLEPPMSAPSGSPEPIMSPEDANELDMEDAANQASAPNLDITLEDAYEADAKEEAIQALAITPETAITDAPAPSSGLDVEIEIEPDVGGLHGVPIVVPPEVPADMARGPETSDRWMDDTSAPHLTEIQSRPFPPEPAPQLLLATEEQDIDDAPSPGPFTGPPLEGQVMGQDAEEAMPPGKDPLQDLAPPMTVLEQSEPNNVFSDLGTAAETPGRAHPPAYYPEEGELEEVSTKGSPSDLVEDQSLGSTHSTVLPDKPHPDGHTALVDTFEEDEDVYNELLEDLEGAIQTEAAPPLSQPDDLAQEDHYQDPPAMSEGPMAEAPHPPPSPAVAPTVQIPSTPAQASSPSYFASVPEEGATTPQTNEGRPLSSDVSVAAEPSQDLPSVAPPAYPDGPSIPMPPLVVQVEDTADHLTEHPHQPPPPPPFSVDQMMPPTSLADTPVSADEALVPASPYQSVESTAPQPDVGLNIISQTVREPGTEGQLPSAKVPEDADPPAKSFDSAGAGIEQSTEEDDEKLWWILVVIGGAAGLAVIAGYLVSKRQKGTVVPFRNIGRISPTQDDRRSNSSRGSVIPDMDPGTARGTASRDAWAEQERTAGMRADLDSAGQGGKRGDPAQSHIGGVYFPFKTLVVAIQNSLSSVFHNPEAHTMVVVPHSSRAKDQPSTSRTAEQNPADGVESIRGDGSTVVEMGQLSRGSPNSDSERVKDTARTVGGYLSVAGDGGCSEITPASSEASSNNFETSVGFMANSQLDASVQNSASSRVWDWDEIPSLGEHTPSSYRYSPRVAIGELVSLVSSFYKKICKNNSKPSHCILEEVKVGPDSQSSKWTGRDSASSRWAKRMPVYSSASGISSGMSLPMLDSYEVGTLNGDFLV